MLYLHHLKTTLITGRRVRIERFGNVWVKHILPFTHLCSVPCRRSGLLLFLATIPPGRAIPLSQEVGECTPHVCPGMLLEGVTSWCLSSVTYVDEWSSPDHICLWLHSVTEYKFTIHASVLLTLWFIHVIHQILVILLRLHASPPWIDSSDSLYQGFTFFADYHRQKVERLGHDVLSLWGRYRLGWIFQVFLNACNFIQMERFEPRKELCYFEDYFVGWFQPTHDA